MSSAEAFVRIHRLLAAKEGCAGLLVVSRKTRPLGKRCGAYRFLVCGEWDSLEPSMIP